MNIKGILKAVIILLVLGFVLNIIGIASASDGTENLIDDIEEYNGSISPDNALYGLKLAFEHFDESFTWNATEKIGKKVLHSRLRISEAKAELRQKNNEAAQKAFEHYKEKVNETEESISEIPGNDSGMLNAQKMILKHQYTLEQLLETNPNNIGLQNAYNKSLELEDDFEQKTERKLERVQTSEGKYILKEIEKKEDKSDKEGEIKSEGSREIKGKQEAETVNKETLSDGSESRKEEITQEKHDNNAGKEDAETANKEILSGSESRKEVITKERDDNNVGKENTRENVKND